MQRLTLTARLTLLYTAVSACVLLGLGALTVQAVNTHFDELDQITLQEKMAAVRHLALDSATLHEFSDRLPDVLQGHEGLLVRVAEGDRVLYATPDAVFPPPVHWQAAQDMLPAPHNDTVTLSVPAAFDPVHHTHFMAQFQQVLWAYVALATLASGLLGWWAARNGLSPLRTMKARAQAVSAHRLDERMPVDAVPVDGIPALVHCLRGGSKDVAMPQAAGALYNLAHDCPGRRADIAAAGAVPLGHGGDLGSQGRPRPRSAPPKHTQFS